MAIGIKKIIHSFTFSSSVEFTSKKYHVSFQTLWWNTQKRFWLLRVNVLLGNKENNKEDKTTNRKEILATASCHRARDIKGKSFPKEEMAEVKSRRGSGTLMSQGGSPESSRESSRGGVWGGAGAGSRAPGRELSHFLSVRSRGGDSVRGVRKHNEAIVRLRKDRSRPGWKYLEQNGRSKRRWEVSRSGAAVKSN